MRIKQLLDHMTKLHEVENVEAREECTSSTDVSRLSASSASRAVSALVLAMTIVSCMESVPFPLCGGRVDLYLYEAQRGECGG